MNGQLLYLLMRILLNYPNTHIHYIKTEQVYSYFWAQNRAICNFRAAAASWWWACRLCHTHLILPNRKTSIYAILRHISQNSNNFEWGTTYKIATIIRCKNWKKRNQLIFFIGLHSLSACYEVQIFSNMSWVYINMTSTFTVILLLYMRRQNEFDPLN